MKGLNAVVLCLFLSLASTVAQDGYAKQPIMQRSAFSVTVNVASKPGSRVLQDRHLAQYENLNSGAITLELQVSDRCDKAVLLHGSVEGRQQGSCGATHGLAKNLLAGVLPWRHETAKTVAVYQDITFVAAEEAADTTTRLLSHLKASKTLHVANDEACTCNQREQMCKCLYDLTEDCIDFSDPDEPLPMACFAEADCRSRDVKCGPATLAVK